MCPYFRESTHTHTHTHTYCLSLDLPTHQNQHLAFTPLLSHLLSPFPPTSLSPSLLSPPPLSYPSLFPHLSSLSSLLSPPSPLSSLSSLLPLLLPSEDYVAGIDVNMGCPKEFSIKASLCVCEGEEGGWSVVGEDGGWSVYKSVCRELTLQYIFREVWGHH